MTRDTGDYNLTRVPLLNRSPTLDGFGCETESVKGLSLDARPASGAGRSTPLRRPLRGFPAVLAFRGVSLELAFGSNNREP